MNKKIIVLIILFFLFSVSLFRMLNQNEPKRIKDLIYKSGEKSISKEDAVEPDLFSLKKELFPPKRIPFKMGEKAIFEPLRFAGKKRKVVPIPVPVDLPPISIVPSNLNIEVGSSHFAEINDAQGPLSISIEPEAIVDFTGLSSPLTFSCKKEGNANATITDGKSITKVVISCSLRPIEKKLEFFTFLGFLESEKEKTIFLSRGNEKNPLDREVIIVKKGDTIVKESASISNNYIVKSLTSDMIIISSQDGSDILEIALVENEPLKKKIIKE